MSALQFLNKKSWHTATIRHNEKVWVKEQEAAKEKQRMEELQKQLEEERKLEEIQRLEVESGRLDASEVMKRRRLNWMYEHGASQTEEERKKEEEKEKEDIMLGKKSMKLDDGEAQENEKEERLKLRDVEAKLREDPMFGVELEKARARTQGNGEVSMVRGRRDDGRMEEVEEKLARKEERRRIREERRIRRERRKRERGLRIDREEVRGKEGSEYGLRLPEGGSGVRVGRVFKAKNREERRTRWGETDTDRSRRGERRHR